MNTVTDKTGYGKYIRSVLMSLDNKTAFVEHERLTSLSCSDDNVIYTLGDCTET
jgi:hypothetical protein